MHDPSRREVLRSLTALALLETLASHRLFGRDVSPIVDDWIAQVDSLSRDAISRKIADTDYQTALEDLYRRVDLPDLLRTLDFDRLASSVDYPALGARSLSLDFKSPDGLTRDVAFGRQVFAMKKGRSVIPHGHNNMSTGFLVLKGRFRGRHWDRVEDHEDHYIIRPTIDRAFSPGEFSTISDHRDNIHWFTAEDDDAFIFNVHVYGTDPTRQGEPGRVYIDPLGEPLSGGLVHAPKITFGAANRKFG